MKRHSVTVTQLRGPEVTVPEVRTSYVEAGQGEPVVLLHGGCVGGSGAHAWSATVRGLAAHFRVIAPDLIWSGYTDKPEVPVSLPLQAAHVAGFIDALGLGRVRIVGQSVGAYLAARYAADHVGRVSHLVMIGSNTVALAMGVAFDTHAPQSTPAADEHERQARLMRRLFHRAELITDELVRERAAIASLPGVASARQSFDAYCQALLRRAGNEFQAFDLRGRLPLLDLPSLLIWGREDRFAPVTIGRDLAPLLPRTRYVEVDGGGHAVFQDCAQTVNELLRRFFTSSFDLSSLPDVHSGAPAP